LSICFLLSAFRSLLFAFCPFLCSLGLPCLC
jgi:hypothetical protein